MTRGEVQRRGLALPLALLLCLALGFIAAAAASFALTSARIARNFVAFQGALDVAEAGLAHGVELLATAYERGAAPPDTVTLVLEDSLGGFDYTVRAEARREPRDEDLNGNGVPDEVVRYDRSWGFAEAAAAGGPLAPGEPVRLVVSRARAGPATEDLLLEVAFERDSSVADPHARGAWRAVPLRWSGLVTSP